MFSATRIAVVLLCLPGLALLAGCGGDASERAKTGDSGVVSTGDDAEDTGGDSGDDSGSADDLAACLAGWTDGVRELDPDGPDTQIHSDVVFDGTQFWFTWNRPNDAANFDVFASAVACDGSDVVAPFMVSESEQNEVDPVLAVGGGQVMFAWTGSPATGVDIRYRSYRWDGTPVTDAAVFAASRDGVPVTGNAMLPDIAASTDGFVLAGSWGHSEAPAFQAFAIGIASDGTLDDDAVDVELDDAVGQTLVDATVQDEQVHLVWQVDSTDSAVSLTRGARLGDAAESLGTPGARPTVVGTPSGIWRAWDDGRGGVELAAPDGTVTTLALGSGVHHSPQLAAYDDTVMLLVMRVESGIYNRLRLLRVGSDGIVDEVPLAADAAPSVYEASVALAGDSHAVVVWQQGVTPAFRAYAEWVSWSL